MLYNLIILMVTASACDGVIYHLNESEYQRMPPVFGFEPYEPCSQDGGHYCSGDYELVSDRPSDLLDMIREYSYQTATHYNHTLPMYGICVTKKCQNLLYNTTVNLSESLEACLNETLWTDYKLKARIKGEVACYGRNRSLMEMDYGDMVVAVALIVLFACIIVGSLEEFQKRPCVKDEENNCIIVSSKFWSCFSITRNWKTLVSNADVKDARQEGMKAFHGLRVIAAILVIFLHSGGLSLNGVDNTKDAEDAYMWLKYMATTSVVVEVFFTMSGFLLAYHAQVRTEKQPFTWQRVFRRLVERWLRLTPPHILLLALTATWMRFLSSGPLWQLWVEKEVQGCRQVWWTFLLYINNYFDGTYCMEQAWYLAADMQLTIVGLIACVMTSGRARRSILFMIFLVGLILPALVTYLYDLDGLATTNPEVMRHFFTEDSTFNKYYKRTYNNMCSYVFGLTCGLLVYSWQKKNFDILKYKKYRIIYWSLLILMVAVECSGSVFYADAPRLPLAVRMTYSALTKPLVGVFVGIFELGLAMEYENFYRSILSLRLWAPLSRLSYCAYLLHIPLMRLYAGTSSTLLHYNVYTFFPKIIALVVAAFVASVPLYLLVEAPVSELVKNYVVEKSKPNAKDQEINLNTQ